MFFSYPSETVDTVTSGNSTQIGEDLCLSKPYINTAKCSIKAISARGALNNNKKKTSIKYHPMIKQCGQKKYKFRKILNRSNHHVEIMVLVTV